MSRTTISVDDLLAELEKIKRASAEGGLTTREMADAWGVSLVVARKRIRAAMAAGLLERCPARKPVAGIDGRLQGVAQFRPVKRRPRR